MIDEEQRQALADLAMRGIDATLEEYGDGASLTAAALVFEVCEDDTDEWRWHGHWETLKGQSPHYTAGLLREAARILMEGDGE